MQVGQGALQVGQGAVAGLGSLFGAERHVKAGQDVVAGLGKNLFGAALNVAAQARPLAQTYLGSGVVTPSRAAQDTPPPPVRGAAGSGGLDATAAPLQPHLAAAAALSRRCTALLAQALAKSVADSLTDAMHAASTEGPDTPAPLRHAAQESAGALAEGLTALQGGLDYVAFRAVLKETMRGVDAAIAGDVAGVLCDYSLPEEWAYEVTQVRSMQQRSVRLQAGSCRSANGIRHKWAHPIVACNCDACCMTLCRTLLRV